MLFFRNLGEQRRVLPSSFIKTCAVSLLLVGLITACRSASLDPLDMPRTYIADSCQYLKDKWSTGKAAPGTVVMTVMFHSITKDAVTSGIQISAQDQRKLMNALFESGFQAINMQQMTDFMYTNAWIPARSVLLIVDDRHHAEYFNDHFKPFYDQWGWRGVN